MNGMQEYFESSDVANKVMCKLCKKYLNSIRIHNLKAHLKTMHNIEIKTTDKCRSKSKITKVKIEINKKEIIRSYIGLVTENGLPFDILNSENMRNIIKPISKALNDSNDEIFSLNADNAKKLLFNVVGKLRALIKDELTNKLFSIKIDSATRLDRNFFGISIQYCKDEQIISRVIGMVELKGFGSTKSKNLAIEIINTLEKYDLNLQQVIAITSDNGANMLKTTSLLSKCLDKFEDQDFLENSDYLSVLDEISNDKDIQADDIIICRCAAHTAQLVAIDVIKTDEVSVFILLCRNFTKFLRKPTNGFRYLLDVNKIRLPQIDCPTRWGSTFRMISDLKSAKPLIVSQEFPTITDFEIDEYFWKKVDDFLLLFQPINSILLKFQEESLTYGEFYANWLRCKLSIQKTVGRVAENSFAKILGDYTLKSFDKRSTTLLNNDILLSCLYFDPRFQHILTTIQRERAIKYLKNIWDRFVSLNKDYEYNVDNSEVENNADEEEDLLTAFLRQDVMEERETNVHRRIEKLKLPFVKSDSCILKFWKERKSADEELYLISSIIYGVPPTQVTIERAFSSLRIILTESRNRLGQDTLENILLVKLNPELLDEAIDEA